MGCDFEGCGDPFYDISNVGAVTQSSQGWSGAPARAIDGNTDGRYGAGSCTHTQNTNIPGSQWWKWRSQYSYWEISHVEIYNRNDCCSGRLTGAIVQAQSQLCGEPLTSARHQVRLCGWRTANEIRIAALNGHYLTLCEVCHLLDCSHSPF